MFDFDKVASPILFAGSETTAYRDPAVWYENGKFYLFCTYVECHEDGPYLTCVESVSENLTDWSAPKEITPRDRSLNFSSPGNIVRCGEDYVLCLQTYCRENGEKYGNDRSRVWTMRSRNLVDWDTPQLLRVKGDIPEAEMGRMIDPFLLRDGEQWRCLYKQNGVSVSVSDDLQHWTYASHTECGENVCVLRDGDEYVIFHSPRNGIGMLRTRDFRHFHPHGELITLGQSEWDWAKGRITAGFVLDLRHEPEYGKYILFFHGSGPEDEQTMFDHHASIGFAWSDDLTHWEYAKGSNE